MPGDKYVMNEHGGRVPARVAERNAAFNRMDELALKERSGDLTGDEKKELAALRSKYPNMTTRYDAPPNIWNNLPKNP